tara:strand:+ start:181 stop:519 length:339 start_codon:yes stop_codon:yes gene_type:complete
MSLHEKYRISSKAAFSHVLDKPDVRFKVGPYFLLGKKNNCFYPRLGVTIKKRENKLAVQRNYLKRKIKNSFNEVVDKLPSLDYVIMVQKNIKGPNYKEDLLLLWERCLKEGG